MAYYMRYITADDKPISVSLLIDALTSIDSSYQLNPDALDDQRAELLYDGERIADLDLNTRGDQLFDEDIEDLVELLTFATDPEAQKIIAHLQVSQTMIVAGVYWDGDDPEPVFSLLDSLWDWLFENRPGLLQADNEGFYDAEQLILEMSTKI